MPAPTLTTFYGVPSVVATSTSDLTHLFGPSVLRIDSNDNIYVLDRGSISGSNVNRILKISANGVNVSVQVAHTLFGSYDIQDFVVIGEDDLFVGVSDRKIYRVTGGSITNITGSGLTGYLDGPGSTAKLGQGNISAMAMVSGNLWWGDFSNPRIRKVDGTGNVSTVAGDGTTSWVNGTGIAAKVGYVFPAAVADLSGNYWFWGGSGSTGYIAKCTPAGVVTTQATISLFDKFSMCLGADSNLYASYFPTGAFAISKLDLATNTLTTPYSFNPGNNGVASMGIVCDSHGYLYISLMGAFVTGMGFAIYKIAGPVTPVVPPGAPKITLQPISASIYVGESATLRSAASGNPTPTVQWQSLAGAGPTTGLPSLNGVLGPWAVGTPGLIYPGDDGYPDPLAGWANVSGATSPNLTVTPSTVGAKRYKAEYLNSSGGATTNSATLTASAAPSGGVGGGDWSDLFNPDALLPSSDVYSPGAGTPGAITRTPKQPGQATILALVREFSSSPRPVSQRPPSGGVGRAIRITGPTTISMVDPAATNSLQSVSADALYSAATSARAASTKALAVLHGTVTTTASATLKANAADILLSGWRIPDKLPVRGIGLRPVKAVEMTFTPKTFTCDVTFHVG